MTQDSTHQHKRQYVYWLMVLFLVVVDQAIKIQVKTSMSLYESIKVTDWCFISFVENSGMAFGMTFINKIVLSLFRIVACSAIGYYLYQQIRKNSRTIYLVCLSLVLAGALGNIVDCTFYGLIFTESLHGHIASVVSIGEGYAPVLMGRVVDMFYFPLVDTYLPEWLPLVGGNHFVFFHPVFNFADACVSVGFVALIIFCRKELKTLSVKETPKSE